MVNTSSPQGSPERSLGTDGTAVTNCRYRGIPSGSEGKLLPVQGAVADGDFIRLDQPWRSYSGDVPADAVSTNNIHVYILED